MTDNTKTSDINKTAHGELDLRIGILEGLVDGLISVVRQTLPPALQDEIDQIQSAIEKIRADECTSISQLEDF